ncbi:MAG TPA: cyclic nucleotide-binding domain-containing protein [Planctomycetaceae bacterium]|nr:cyclic nucleotide-binding domain-containing protein [Planctomycetaceae bacterium]
MTNATTVVSPIFDGFTAEEYESTLALLEQRSYAKGDVILHEGKSEQALWILIKGTCEVVKKNKGTTLHTLATLESGSAFGEMSFFQKAPHSATVRASSAVKVLRMTRENYEQLHTRNPTAAYKITQIVVSLLAERLRRMDEWICDHVEQADGAPHREEWHDFRAKLYSGWPF